MSFAWEVDFLGWTVQPFVSMTGQGVERGKSLGVGRVEAISSGSEKLEWIHSYKIPAFSQVCLGGAKAMMIHKITAGNDCMWSVEVCDTLCVSSVNHLRQKTRRIVREERDKNRL